MICFWRTIFTATLQRCKDSAKTLRVAARSATLPPAQWAPCYLQMRAFLPVLKTLWDVWTLVDVPWTWSRPSCFTTTKMRRTTSISCWPRRCPIPLASSRRNSLNGLGPVSITKMCCGSGLNAYVECCLCDLVIISMAFHSFQHVPATLPHKYLHTHVPAHLAQARILLPKPGQHAASCLRMDVCTPSSLCGEWELAKLGHCV